MTNKYLNDLFPTYTDQHNLFIQRLVIKAMSVTSSYQPETNGEWGVMCFVVKKGGLIG